MREALLRLGAGASRLWILLVALLILGRYTPAPSFRLVRLGVVVGAAGPTAVGAFRLIRRGYGRLARRLDKRSDAA